MVDLIDNLFGQQSIKNFDRKIKMWKLWPKIWQKGGKNNNSCKNWFYVTLVTSCYNNIRLFSKVCVTNKKSCIFTFNKIWFDFKAVFSKCKMHHMVIHSNELFLWSFKTQNYVPKLFNGEYYCLYSFRSSLKVFLGWSLYNSSRLLPKF